MDLALGNGIFAIFKMILVFVILYFGLLHWWKQNSRVKQSLRVGLWSVVLFLPFAVNPAMRMGGERGLRGLIVIAVVLFIVGLFFGAIYTLISFYRAKNK
ncbi:MAG: hypothetical protein R3271_01785 [Methylophaga sp.]|uniref:hypothetical protein n=1 Tax=Methylophaga sp. TaxID=2024840 RepID=UPI00299CDFE9|nr:hypothetical protein [Methylophaga sp.]MDX1749033.1 hypothetical protein [Methylophaga sp.]